MAKLKTLLVFAGAALMFGQSYSGPRPPSPDLPYLLHADKLIPLEATEARQSSAKDEDVYVIKGDSAPVKTPMAEPMFVYEPGQIPPERMKLYKLEVRNGNREAVFSSKKRKNTVREFHLSITRLSDKLFRIEAAESLENGQYSLSPTDSNHVFCFEVF